MLHVLLPLDLCWHIICIMIYRSMIVMILHLSIALANG